MGGRHAERFASEWIGENGSVYSCAVRESTINEIGISRNSRAYHLVRLVGVSPSHVSSYLEGKVIVFEIQPIEGKDFPQYVGISANRGVDHKRFPF